MLGARVGVVVQETRHPLARVWSEGECCCVRNETPTGSRLERGWVLSCEKQDTHRLAFGARVTVDILQYNSIQLEKLTNQHV
jgi:hypothetical protein